MQARRHPYAVLAAVLLAAAAAPRASAIIVLFSDDFESYTSTAEMNAAGNWGDNGKTANPGTLSTSGGNPGQFMSHPAGSTAQHNFAAPVPTDALPLVWKLDFFDDGAGNKRITGGLRDNGGGAPLAALLEMGRYNDVFNPDTGTQVSGYAVRTVFVGGAPANWVTFEGNPSVQTGWHTLTATIRSSDILFELDFGADGIVDTNRLITTTAGAKPYNVVRLGGPSDLSSAGGGAGFDNVSIGLFQPAAEDFAGLTNLNTGKGEQGNLLLANAVDPHWTVQRVAAADSPAAAGQGDPTFVLPQDGFPIPPWLGNGPDSQWIVPTRNNDGNDAEGFYDYSVEFELTGPEATGLSILGQWATDNAGVDIFVNGVSTGQTAAGFGGFSQFEVGGLAAGLNRLTFRVENLPTSDNPTGIRVELTDISYVPEPATVLLLVAGAPMLLRRRAANERRLG